MNNERAFVITGPTSGIGYRTALELATHGTVVLVGRDTTKLDAVKHEIEKQGQHAFSVVCDVSDIASVRRAAQEIVELRLPIVGLFNNAGIRQARPTKSAQGWDSTFATNHIGPFALTEALLPHLPDGANVVFVGSAVEDPERKAAVMAGFRGGRYISAEASARGEWKLGGSKNAGFDAYATSKQCAIATALAFARENPRLRINVFEPGFMPTTNLSRDAPTLARIMAKILAPLIVPFLKHASTPKRAGRVGTQVLLNAPGKTGAYFGERGQAIQGSPLVHDPKFADRVVAETRALLATLPASGIASASAQSRGQTTNP